METRFSAFEVTSVYSHHAATPETKKREVDPQLLSRLGGFRGLGFRGASFQASSGRSVIKTAVFADLPKSWAPHVTSMLVEFGEFWLCKGAQDVETPPYADSATLHAGPHILVPYRHSI